MVPRPSDEPARCGERHPGIADTYGKALHYSAQGLREGVIGRFSAVEAQVFDPKVFEQSCRSCHPPDREQTDKAKEAHQTHDGILSCAACHSLSTYKNCKGCHLGKGAEASTGFFLGKNPHNMSEVTTLRRVPAARDTFAAVSLTMSHYDALPNYWDATPHVINKLTERTNNCYMCHMVKMGFLKASDGAPDITINAEAIPLPTPFRRCREPLPPPESVRSSTIARCKRGLSSAPCPIL